MGSTKALGSGLFLAGAALVGTLNVVSAADLLPPPPMPVYAAPVDTSGWYLRGDLGVGINQLNSGSYTFNAPIPSFGVDQREISQQAIVGIGVGYQVNSWFRADVTGEYRFGNNYQAVEHYAGSPNCPIGSGYLCTDGYHGTIRDAVFLANGYVDLGTWYGVTPYIGAGVGTAINTFSGLTDTALTNPPAGGVAADKTSMALAYAGMAGITYALTPNIKLDFGYRYLNMGRVSSNQIVCNAPGCSFEQQSFRLSSQDIRLGLRYVFADVAPLAPPLQPLPPPPPLIRKY